MRPGEGEGEGEGEGQNDVPHAEVSRKVRDGPRVLGRKERQQGRGHIMSRNVE